MLLRAGGGASGPVKGRDPRTQETTKIYRLFGFMTTRKQTNDGVTNNSFPKPEPDGSLGEMWICCTSRAQVPRVSSSFISESFRDSILAEQRFISFSFGFGPSEDSCVISQTCSCWSHGKTSCPQIFFPRTLRRKLFAP